ncbi:MAG: WD40/YVTN/BNR-like repeat-containing protein [Chitinophagaceae bacterium]
MGSQYVLKSVDAGKRWKIISTDLSSGDSSKIKVGGSGGITPDNTGAEIHGTIYSLSQSPLDAKMIWAGTDDGRLHLTLNDGTTWQQVNKNWPAEMKDLWIEGVIASNHKKNRAYIIVDGHRSDVFQPFIMLTEDAGKSWKSIANNISTTEVLRSFIEDAKNENLLFAGTETGVWFSINQGQQWNRLSRNFPVVSVYDLKIHPRERDLIAATHGRSLWIMDDIGYLQQFTPAVQKSKAWLFEHKPIVLWENTSRGGQRGHFLFAGENPPGISNASSKPRAVTSQSTFITFYISDASNGNIKLTITDPVKQNKKVIDTTVAAGIHRIAWDLKFDAPSLTDKEIKTIDSLVMSIPEVENSSLTALRRLKQAKTSSEQRQFVERLVNLNSGIPIPEKLLPVKALPGLYSIELKAGTILQKANLKINDDPLNKK